MQAAAPQVDNGLITKEGRILTNLIGGGLGPRSKEGGGIGILPGVEGEGWKGGKAVGGGGAYLVEGFVGKEVSCILYFLATNNRRAESLSVNNLCIRVI